MNKEQKEKIRESIRKDAHLSGQYYDVDAPGDYCVIAGLYASAGRNPVEGFRGVVCRRIVAFEAGHVTGAESEKATLRNAAEFLMGYYGLTLDQLSALQLKNDQITVVRERRRALLALVDKFPVEGGSNV